MHAAEPSDRIFIKAMRISSRIGVPEEERARPQSLEIDLEIVPSSLLMNLQDDVTQTIDYYEVWTRIHEIANERPRKLIETLAEDISKDLLDDERILETGVTVRKFILPDTGCVEVSVRRRQEKA